MFKSVPIRLASSIVLGSLLCTPGCSSYGPVEKIQVSAANDPLSQPRSILERYSAGQPLGSESTMFPQMIDSVKKVDQDRGKILEEGFKKLQEMEPSERADFAKELLDKIKPSMNPK